MTVGQKICLQLLMAFPDAPSKTLARRAYAEYPEVWPNFNAAYDCLRHLRGNHGKRSRKRNLDYGVRRPNQKAGFVM